MTWNQLKDLKLETERVRLRRISVNDFEALEKIVFQPSIWEFFVTRISDAVDLTRFIETAIQDTLNGTRIVFLIEDRLSGRVVGSRSCKARHRPLRPAPLACRQD